MIYKFLVNFILRRLLNFDFVNEISEEKKLGTYARMNDKATVELLKYLYTNNYSAFLLANGDDALILKGRILQLLDMINSIENAEDGLLRITEHNRIKGEVKKILAPIKDKLFRKVGRSFK